MLREAESEPVGVLRRDEKPRTALPTVASAPAAARQSSARASAAPRGSSRGSNVTGMTVVNGNDGTWLCANPPAGGLPR